MASNQRANIGKGPILLPGIIVVIGLVLLLGNFLLIDFFTPLILLPLLLVILGLQILLQGDFIPGQNYRTFGITRGSVEEATLEVSAGDIDITLGAFPSDQTGRLIAGQYAPQARPYLDVDGLHAHLVFQRQQTAWLSMMDWEMVMARDLPWRVYASSSTGQIKADFTGLITDDITLTSGIGDIHFSPPHEAFQPIYLETSLGNIHIVTPVGSRVRIHIQSYTLASLHIDQQRYEQTDDGIIVNDHEDDAPETVIHVENIYGDIYIA